MDTSNEEIKQNLDGKDEKWNKKKKEVVSAAGALSGAEFDNPNRDTLQKWSNKLQECSNWLLFADYQNLSTAELQRKLKNAALCRVRGCPICEWRKSLMNYARGLKRLPEISKEHPTYEFLFLTLTWKNCSVYDLRESIQHANKAWRRLTQRKAFNVVKGFVRTTEVTMSQRDGSANPHFHVILVVPSYYFKHEKYYLNLDAWIQLWRKCAKLDFDPNVDIKRIKKNALGKGIVEALKYSIGGVADKEKSKKPRKLIHNEDPAFFREMLVQLKALRLVNCGGILSDLFKEDADNDELINTGLEETEDEDKPDEFTDENGDVWRELEEVLFRYRDGIYRGDPA